VVSHGQSTLVAKLLSDLDKLEWHDFEVIVTSNLPENSSIYIGRSYPVKVIKNAEQKGFGANHNAAFSFSRGRYFAILNPDIRIPTLNIDHLLKVFDRANVGAVAPVILSINGTIEDSARRFPTVTRLMRRVFLRQRQPDYLWDNVPIEVDWIGGMFVLFRPEAFNALNGFDVKRFFMYMEDVDICERLWRNGWAVMLQPQVNVIHDAQRASHRNIKHLRWHLVSAIRYLTNI
jgi:GT2 family glycosyltransferase